MIWPQRFPGGIAALALLTAGCQTQSAYQPPPPPKVTVTQPVVETIPVYHEENGETEAVEQAIVSARVRGILEEILVESSQVVTQGTPLFRIEQKEYQAALQAAQAKVSSANAALVSAEAAVSVADAAIAAADAEISVTEADFNRLDGLLKENAIAQSEWEASRANLEMATAAKQGVVARKEAALAEIKNAEANVEKANAELTQANLDLEWTVVTAPIDGRVTRTIVKRGNLVENGTELIEIVKNDPIWANFNLSERFLLDLQRESGRDGRQAQDTTNVKVYLKRSGDVGFPFEGNLDYFDPRVDQDTGRLLLRGVFANDDPDKQLLPGLFVRVRIQIGTLEDALLIPERAISRDQAGSFVYVVDSNKKAVRKNVTLGTKFEEQLVVLSGIEAGDSVIVDGLQRVRPGLEVDPG